MTSKKIVPVILAFLLLRIVISIAISDGTLRSDSLNYFGLSHNIARHFEFSALVPEHDQEFADGKTIPEITAYFDQHPGTFRRLMNFQWLHSLLYLPVILLFRSIDAVIIVNNILLFGAGWFLLEIVRDAIKPRDHIISWFVFLFFPPFFYLTNQFYSEPLFVFFLAFIINRLVLQKEPGALFMLSLILLSVTRGFGLLFTAALLTAAASRKNWKHASLFALCGVSAIGLNWMVGANNRDARYVTVESPPPVIHSVYFSNTINGNGDNDYFLVYPEKRNEDPYFSAFMTEGRPSIDVLAELFKQNAAHPGIFLHNTWNKLTAYFLNVIPDSWGYRNNVQPIYRKVLWSVQNIVLMGLIWIGFRRSGAAYRRYFSVLFWISFLVHYIALSRYRYFQPVLIAGLPAVGLAVSRITERLSQFKTNDAPPH